MEQDQKIKIAVFYSFNELNIKDTEHELFTENKEKFHYFFFNNHNLHFSKTKILNDVLLEKFEDKKPTFLFSEKKGILQMRKDYENFDFKHFDLEVDERYNDYLSKINYRIDCIFQTFTLFSELYRDKHLIFVFPAQLLDRFNDLLQEKELQTVELNKLHDYIRKFDLFHWIGFYSRETDLSDPTIEHKHIVKILQVT